MKQVPNLFTLLNLLFGCLAIVMILQPGLTISIDSSGQQMVEVPQKIYWASVYIGLAAVIDFLDGLVARLIKGSSEMGKQLDSLADAVSFGVAPGMIAFEFLRLSYASQQNGLNVNMLCLLPAFLIPCAGAYRLARFNIDPEQSYGFKGVPIPAAGLLIAAFPLIYWFSSATWVINTMQNKWFWYAVIVVVSYLMISTLPMMAMKFKGITVKKMMPFIILAVIGIVTGFIFGWLAVPVTFIAYVLLSLLTHKQSS
jgi:CDP-diacylglycerol--serine O-phosphatidyltransferase